MAPNRISYQPNEQQSPFLCLSTEVRQHIYILLLGGWHIQIIDPRTELKYSRTPDGRHHYEEIPRPTTAPSLRYNALVSVTSRS